MAIRLAGVNDGNTTVDGVEQCLAIYYVMNGER